MPRAQNAFERFRLLRAYRGGGATVGTSSGPGGGNFVTYEPEGEAGDGPHYALTDDGDRITWDLEEP